MQTAIDPVFAGWDGSVRQARQLQQQLAGQVVLDDRWTPTPQLLAGFDVGFEDDGQTTRAAAVLLDAHTLLPLETQVARVPTSMPYVPGLLSFRELPALLQALALLSRTPDLVFIDGQGIAHPRRLGIAAHFGVVTGLPSIGVAKQRLAGECADPGPVRGDHTPLRLGGAQIGWALRSKPRCNPLIVSPGHRVSLQGALDWTLRTLRSYRLPEPTRLADRLASRRGDITLDASGDLLA
ncbi:deoxyribonuclease V [Xanthomonas maliensis]|uniref:deoxyribonuclease V n=1 Tax=Xanthomonas maliensis TaxID=1321368 RepID=UPI0004CF8205|nr:deoxyribonuclease V [Xanthomonas maliensis]KAB7770201.1 deoxyribonuclease V [Xanthomonas maliensis]